MHVHVHCTLYSVHVVVKCPLNIKLKIRENFDAWEQGYTCDKDIHSTNTESHYVHVCVHTYTV